MSNYLYSMGGELSKGRGWISQGANQPRGEQARVWMSQGVNQQRGKKSQTPTRWHRRRTVTAATTKRRDVSCFCCRLCCPFVFPSSFHPIRLCHVIDIYVCSFLPYNRRSWLLTSLSVCLIGRLRDIPIFAVPSSLTSSCPSLWSIVAISHTPHGVRI